MLLNDLLQAVSNLSHQDKLRLIHFLLLEVAREEGYNLESTDNQEQEEALLKQLESTEAVIWSLYEAYEAAQTLSELLAAAKQEGHACISLDKIHRSTSDTWTHEFLYRV